MSENARELYALAPNRNPKLDAQNRYQDSSNPIRLADGAAIDRWADQAKQLIGNRTELRDDFGEHMETVRRRTEEELKRNVTGDNDGGMPPKKLSEHRRKHLHLYSNKPGSEQSSQGTAVTRNRSESPHGIELQSARTRQNNANRVGQRASENEQVEGQQRQIIAEKHITKTYRYGSGQNVEVEEIEEIDYKVVGGKHNTNRAQRRNEATQRPTVPIKAIEYQEDLALQDHRASYTKYKQNRNKSKRNSGQNAAPESIFRKLHDKAQNLYSNLNAESGTVNVQPTRDQKGALNDGSISNNSNSLDSQSQLYINTPNNRNQAEQKHPTSQRTENQYYMPEGQRLMDEKLNQVRRRNRQIQRDIDIQLEKQTNVQVTQPLQNGLGVSGNFEVNRSVETKNIVIGQWNAPTSKKETFGARTESPPREQQQRNQGITVMQNRQQQQNPRRESPQFNGGSDRPLPQPFQPSSEEPHLNEMITRLAKPHPQQSSNQELPEILQALKNDQGRFNEMIIRETSQQRFQLPQKDQPNEKGNFVGQFGGNPQQKPMGEAEMINQLRQQTKQINQITASKRVAPAAIGRTEPARLSYESDERFDDSDVQSPQINSTKQKNNRLKQGEELLNIIENHSNGHSIDQDLAGGSIIDDLGKGGSVVQQQSSMAGYKHSEFQHYENSSNLGAQGGQISIQSVQQKSKPAAPPSNQPPLISVQPPQPPAIPYQQAPVSGQRANIHIPPTGGEKTITLGPASIGPSVVTNISPTTQVQHSRSQSPVRTSGVGVPPPVFYSPPHAASQNNPAHQTKVLNQRMMELVQTGGSNFHPTTNGTTIRRSNVFEPTGSGYNVLPHQLPCSDRNIAAKPSGGLQPSSVNPPTFNNLAVPGQAVAPPTISTSRVLLPGGMQQTTTTTTTKQLVQLGAGVVPGETTITTSRVRTSNVGPILPYADQMAPDTERRLVGPNGNLIPVGMASQGPPNLNSGPGSQLPTVVGQKKKGTCLSCCRCSIF